MDLNDLSKYRPIAGYAPLGGRASFEREGNSLRTVSLEYAGQSYSNFSDPEVEVFGRFGR